MRNTTQLIGLGIAFALTAACDHPYTPDEPAIDPTAPRIEITSPSRGTVLGDVTTVTVTGTATDDTGVASVTVNGITATLATDGTWSAQVPLGAGTQLLHAVALDASGNAGKETRAVVAGPMQPLAQAVTDALTASFSAQTFAAVAKGAGTYLKTADLMSFVSNPVVDVGTTNGQPDCLYAQAFVTSVSLGDAQITLSPNTGALDFDAELDNIKVGMHLQYAVSCIDGSRDVTIAASHLSLAGSLDVAIAAGNTFDVTLANPQVALQGFDVDLGGVPGWVVDNLGLDTAAGPIIAWIAEKAMSPVMNSALGGLNKPKTVDVLGTSVAISVAPTRLDFDPSGAIMAFDTTIRATGDTGNFVYVPNTEPTLSTDHGFELAIVDDAANQMLTSLWSAKGLEKTLDLTTGSYGDVGKLYDSVQISAAVPPFVDASSDGLKLTIGDLMATFKNGDSVTTEVAINAQVDVKAVANPDGSLRLDVGTPTVYVDILDQNVDGANELSNANFEQITSFALSRIVSFGSSAVGAVPLPTIGGVSMKNVGIAAQTGYLVVDGEVQ